MDGLEALVKLINSYLWGKWLVYVLLGLGILYTISNGFIQIRHFGFIIRRTLIDSFKTRHEDKGSGSISTFKAMMVTLAGNVGGGNVVGVATANCIRWYGCCLLDVGCCIFWHGAQIW